MPSARSSSAARSTSPASAPGRSERSRQTPRPAPRPRGVKLPGSMVRLRWERLGRTALLVVFAAVIGLYVTHAVSYLTTRSRATQARATVTRLASQNHALEREAKALQNPATIQREARQLGMIRTGEQPYSVIPKSGH